MMKKLLPRASGPRRIKVTGRERTRLHLHTSLFPSDGYYCRSFILSCLMLKVFVLSQDSYSPQRKIPFYFELKCDLANSFLFLWAAKRSDWDASIFANGLNSVLETQCKMFLDGVEWRGPGFGWLF